MTAMNIMTNDYQSSPLSFYDNLHVSFITSLASKLNYPGSYEGAMTEHLRMSGVYWSVAAMCLLRKWDEVDTLMGFTSPVSTLDDKSSVNEKEKNNLKSCQQSILDWIFSCYDYRRGGFGGNVDHDAHLLYTLSALQLLAMSNSLSDPRLDRTAVVNFIQSLQHPDGSFAGDEWGETDTRFSYCALCSLSILGVLPPHDQNYDPKTHVVNVKKAATYISSCINFDGGYGCITGAESHAGQIFCCVAALSLTHSLHLVDADLLCWWLAERQCDSGGLNGRPEKQADVCYSWWILSSLSIMGRVEWIDITKLGEFIMRCQDDEDGGISDRPDNMADAFHTFFGIAGLSLSGLLHSEKVKIEHKNNNNDSISSFPSIILKDETRDVDYQRIDPVYALPIEIVKKLKLRRQIMCLKKR